jgi:hypothetical protein
MLLSSSLIGQSQQRQEAKPIPPERKNRAIVQNVPTDCLIDTSAQNLPDDDYKPGERHYSIAFDTWHLDDDIGRKVDVWNTKVWQMNDDLTVVAHDTGAICIGTDLGWQI